MYIRLCVWYVYMCHNMHVYLPTNLLGSGTWHQVMTWHDFAKWISGTCLQTPQCQSKCYAWLWLIRSPQVWNSSSQTLVWIILYWIFSCWGPKTIFSGSGLETLTLPPNSPGILVAMCKGTTRSLGALPLLPELAQHLLPQGSGQQRAAMKPRSLILCVYICIHICAYAFIFSLEKNVCVCDLYIGIVFLCVSLSLSLSLFVSACLRVCVSVVHFLAMSTLPGAIAFRRPCLIRNRLTYPW